MTRREFLSSLPESIREAGSRLLPEVRRIGWLKGVFLAGDQSRPNDRVVTLDEARCPACGDAECRCERLTPSV